MDSESEGHGMKRKGGRRYEFGSPLNLAAAALLASLFIAENPALPFVEVIYDFVSPMFSSVFALGLGAAFYFLFVAYKWLRPEDRSSKVFEFLKNSAIEFFMVLLAGVMIVAWISLSVSVYSVFSIGIGLEVYGKEESVIVVLLGVFFFFARWAIGPLLRSEIEKEPLGGK